jgi:hypothetical protein
MLRVFFLCLGLVACGSSVSAPPPVAGLRSVQVLCDGAVNQESYYSAGEQVGLLIPDACKKLEVIIR